VQFCRGSITCPLEPSPRWGIILAPALCASLLAAGIGDASASTSAAQTSAAVQNTSVGTTKMKPSGVLEMALPPASPAPSLAAPTPPVSALPPLISGTAEEGQTLSASSGAWLGNLMSYAYQWQSCDGPDEGCSSVSGATSSTYELTASDVGGIVRVVVRASDAGGVQTATSAATPTVGDALLYSPSSLWNTPIGTSPDVSINSASEIKELDGGNSKKGCEYEPGIDCLSSDFEYTPTLWYATASTPKVKVEIDYPTCDASSVEVPIESGWVPDPSGEGHMAVLGYNGTEYDLWQAQVPNKPPKSHYADDKGAPKHSCPTVDAWTAGEVLATTNWNTGLAQEGGVHASNTPEGAGLITQKDLESKASYWPHALAFAYTHNCKEALSWCGRPLPANGIGDGTCKEEAICIPEGARIQLEPSFDCSIGNNEIKYRWEEQWCRTLQKFGMIDVDSTADDRKAKGSGAVIWAQQFGSWTNGFRPPWRTEYRAGSALVEGECKAMYEASAPSWCVGERAGVMPMGLLAHMRVLKW
jgi:hypothetical protein